MIVFLPSSTSVFSAYGTFWMSYAAILIPGSGILAAYGDNTQELSNAIGLYLIVWFMFTLMLMYVSHSSPPLFSNSLHTFPISPVIINKNLAFSLLLTAIAVTLILLAAAEFTNKARQVNFNPHSFKIRHLNFILFLLYLRIV